MAKGWLIGGGSFLIALLIASVVVVLTEEEEPLPEGTPEAAVQRYLNAAEEEDFPVVHSYLSADLRDECSVQELAAGSRRDDVLKRSRITLEDSEALTDDSALVTVQVIEVSGGGPFDRSEWTHTQRYSLTQEDGQWRFTEYPWPNYGCGGPSRAVPIFPAPAATPEVTPTATVEPTPTTRPAP